MNIIQRWSILINWNIVLLLWKRKSWVPEADLWPSNFHCSRASLHSLASPVRDIIIKSIFILFIFFFHAMPKWIIDGPKIFFQFSPNFPGRQINILWSFSVELFSADLWPSESILRMRRTEEEPGSHDSRGWPILWPRMTQLKCQEHAQGLQLAAICLLRILMMHLLDLLCPLHLLSA